MYTEKSPAWYYERCSLWERCHWAGWEDRDVGCLLKICNAFDWVRRMTRFEYNCSLLPLIIDIVTVSTQMSKRAHSLLLIWMCYPLLVICCSVLLLMQIVHLNLAERHGRTTPWTWTSHTLPSIYQLRSVFHMKQQNTLSVNDTFFLILPEAPINRMISFVCSIQSQNSNACWIINQFYDVTMVKVWWGLCTKGTWLGLGKGNGLGSNNCFVMVSGTSWF